LSQKPGEDHRAFERGCDHGWWDASKGTFLLWMMKVWLLILC
jgi:hypothetical protein